MIKPKQEILGQVEWIREQVRTSARSVFAPRLVEVFLDLSAIEAFWFDLVSLNLGSLIRQRVREATVKLDISGTLALTEVFSKIIDFRSPFTATHSAGVAASARNLGGLMGFTSTEQQLITMAGYLHDLGKLAVPKRILEKPGGLTRDEINVVRRHSYYTYRTLQTVRGFELINEWASFHHERLDGKGYPFHKSKRELSLGSRIMSVADIFTALAEDRPYRAGMTIEQAMAIIRRSTDDNGLDPDVVKMLEANVEEVDSTRIKAQQAVARRFEQYKGML